MNRNSQKRSTSPGIGGLICLVGFAIGALTLAQSNDLAGGNGISAAEAFAAQAISHMTTTR